MLVTEPNLIRKSKPDAEFAPKAGITNTTTLVFRYAQGRNIHYVLSSFMHVAMAIEPQKLKNWLFPKSKFMTCGDQKKDVTLSVHACV